jgi:transcriptional regulator with XRE-family HTH domain
MSKSHNDLNDLAEAFKDKEFRESYAEDFLNTHIASQIRVIREQRELTQEDLAELVDTKQTGISRVENVNYSAWNIKTLKRLAFALQCRLHVSFETFGSLLEEGSSFSRSALKRPSFEADPIFASYTKPSLKNSKSYVDAMSASQAPGQHRGMIYRSERLASERADSQSASVPKSGLQEEINPSDSQPLQAAAEAQAS